MLCVFLIISFLNFNKNNKKLNLKIFWHVLKFYTTKTNILRTKNSKYFLFEKIVIRWHSLCGGNLPVLLEGCSYLNVHYNIFDLEHPSSLLIPKMPTLMVIWIRAVHKLCTLILDIFRSPHSPLQCFCYMFIYLFCA